MVMPYDCPASADGPTEALVEHGNGRAQQPNQHDAKRADAQRDDRQQTDFSGGIKEDIYSQVRDRTVIKRTERFFAKTAIRARGSQTRITNHWRSTCF